MSQTFALYLLYLASAFGLHLLVRLGRDFLRADSGMTPSTPRPKSISATGHRRSLRVQAAPLVRPAGLSSPAF